MYSFVQSLARSLNLVWVLQILISHGKAFHKRIPLFMKEFRANSVLKVVFSEFPEDVANLVPYRNCFLILICRKSGFPSNLILRINTRLCSTTICLTDNHPHWCSKVATEEFQERRVTILAILNNLKHRHQIVSSITIKLNHIANIWHNDTLCIHFPVFEAQEGTNFS